MLWLLAPGDGEASVPPGRRLLRIGTKADLNRHRDDCDLVVSATTGDGIPELLRRLEEEAAALMGTGADALLTRERHRAALEDAYLSLTNAIDMLRRGGARRARRRRSAAWPRGRWAEITGRVDVEDVLDRLFSSFCIGK